MLGEVDRSGNFFMSFGEFIALMNRKTRESDDEEILEAFKMFAKDKDGLIKFENLRQVCDDIEAFLPDTVPNRRVNDEEISEMIKLSSLDTGFTVNSEDFMNTFGNL